MQHRPLRGPARARRPVAIALLATLVGASLACSDPSPSAAPDQVDDAAQRALRPTEPPVLSAPPAQPIPVTPPCPPGGPPVPAPAAAPAELGTEVARQLADPRLTSQDVSLSVEVDGWGEVVAVEPQRALLPASNQKLLTAMGALEVLPADGRFETRVLAPSGSVDGVVAGDLVLEAGGDPTLDTAGLDDLAAQVREAGIEEVAGALVVDESRFDTRRAAEGWLDWQRPAYVGSLSALVVDENRYRADQPFLDDPALAGADRLVAALARHGVAVDGPVVHGEASDGQLVARRASATFAELVGTMLTTSDNMIAESLVREVGVQARHDGSTPAGLAAIRDALAVLCVPLDGRDHDGSGLSRGNARSAAEWRRLLDAARTRPWWPRLLDGLPLAGRTGTLAGRLGAPATAGKVRAKTGSIIPGRALSGYATTVGGRDVVFSLVVNGDHPAPAQDAFDALLTAIVAHPG